MKRTFLTLCLHTVTAFCIGAVSSAPAPCAEWRQMDSGTTRHLYALWGSAPDDLFAVGQTGTILHYDGYEWTSQSERSNGKLHTNDSLYAVWGTSSDEVYAAGRDGTLLLYDGSQWSLTGSATITTINCLRSVPPDTLYAVGDSGLMMRYEDEEWTVLEPRATEPLYALWGPASDEIFAAGGRGRILKYDGTYWYKLERFTDNHLHSIWGLTENDAIAVGEGGVLFQYDGSEWHGLDSPTSHTLRSVRGSSWANIIAVGDDGTILSWDGFAWNSDESGTDAILQDVWPFSTDDIFVVGNNGVILRYSNNTTTTTSSAETTTTSTGTTTAVSTTSASSTSTTTAAPDRDFDFVASPTSGFCPLKVQFTCLADEQVSAYDWNFGDLTETVPDPSPVHTYTNPGTYSVILTVTLPDTTSETVVKESYITVSSRFACPFATVLTDDTATEALRRLRAVKHTDAQWRGFFNLFYRNGSELTGLLQKYPWLRDRFTQLVRRSTVYAAMLCSEQTASVPEALITDVCALMKELAARGSKGFKHDAAFVVKEFREGRLLERLGITVLRDSMR